MRKVLFSALLVVLFSVVALVLMSGCVSKQTEVNCFSENEVVDIGKISDDRVYNLDENFSIKFSNFLITGNPKIFEGQIVEEKEGHRFVIIEAEITNLGKVYGPIALEQTSWGQFSEIEGNDGKIYRTEYNLQLFGLINPGESKTIRVGAWLPVQVEPKFYYLGGYRNPVGCESSSFEKIKIELE